MQGAASKQEGMFSYVSLEAWVPTKHPLGPIQAIEFEALEHMDRKLEMLYSQAGRPGDCQGSCRPCPARVNHCETPG